MSDLPVPPPPFPDARCGDSVIVYRSEGERLVDQFLWHQGGWWILLGLFGVLVVLRLWGRRTGRR